MKRFFKTMAFTLLGLVLSSDLMAADTWEKLTSVPKAGDVVILVNETAKREMTGISTTSTKYGLATTYETSPAGSYPLTVCAGNSDESLAFKTSDNKYLYWTSGNSLNVNATLDNKTSWTVTVSNGDFTITNVGDNSRVVKYNSNKGQERFACYTSEQQAVQLYKKKAADPTFNITAQSNNTDYGTVSLSGSVITATPKPGCRYATLAYTVTSGTATVEQDGNEFTVTPTSDCTVRINFEATPTHTVTWSVSGETSFEQVAEGAAINFENASVPTVCGEKVFRGWVSTPIVGVAETEPTYVTSATMGTQNITYYAVFADESAGGTTSVTKDIIAEAGVTASQTLNGTAYQIGDLPIQLTATKGTSNWPVINYNATNGNDLRFYKSSSSVTFATTNSQPITKIEFKKNSTTNSNLYTYFSANVGTLSSNVWTGSSTSVTITFSNTDNYKEQMYIVNVTYSATGGKTYSNFVTSCVVDDRTPVKMTDFSAETTTLLRGATTTTSVTNDQIGWTAAYTYASSDEDVATVNETGVITAVGRGTANITATLNVDPEDATYKADEENKSKSIEITVNNPKVTVNFFVNGTQLAGLDESLTSQEEGANLVCPANPSDIGSKVFVGWKLGEISGSTDDKPELVTASTVVGNTEQTYYAVFATESEVESNTYSLVSSASDLSDGNRVLLYDKYNKKAVKVNNNALAASDAVTSLPDQFSNPDASIVWTLIADNSNWKIAHGGSTLGAAELPTSGSKDAALTATNNTWYFNKSTYSGYTDCFYIMNAGGDDQLFELSSGKWVVYKASSYTSWGTVRIYKAGTEIQYTAYVTTIASEYAITVDGSIANGSVEASAASATAGSTIELTATPASDAYDFEAWNVYKTGEPATKVTVIDGEFTMPNYAVTVSATFKATDRALITWESFGTQFTQTYVSREGKIQMPAGAPTNESGCSSKYKYFMGWSTAIEGVATEAPTYITTETAAPTENTTYFAVFAKGQEGETVKELTFPDDDYETNGVSGYDKTWTAKNGSDSWSVANLNNNNWNNSWEYIKCGSKNAASVATLATDFAIEAAIKKVVINANLKEDNLNSATLYISSTDDFTSVEAVVGTIVKAETAADYEFVIPTPAANKYYKLTFDCAKGNNNGFLQINSIAYKTADVYEGYATTCPSAYAITVSQPEQGGLIGASVASAEAGETITLTANPATGYTTGTWDVYKTGESTTKVTVTDNEFTMPAYPVTVEYAFTEIKVTSITLNKTEYAMDANSAFQLEVTAILPADALNKEVEWSTSDASVATVSETGLVSGVAASATPVVITATSKSDNTITATCSFTITDPIVWDLTGITVTKPTTTTFAEGAEFTDASLTGMVVMGQYENSIDPTDTKEEPIVEGYTVKIGEHALPYTITHEDALASTMKVTVTYNEQSDNFDLTLVPSYKTTWKVNGVPQTGAAYPATADAENKISLPTATAEALVDLFGDDQYQFFRGWATAELEEEATSETGIVYAQAGDEISEDKTYFAVFAKGEMAEGWNINTEAPAANESVVLAAKDNGTYYAFAASGEAVVANELTVTDGKITSEAPFAWTISEESDKLYLKLGDNYVHFNSKSMKVTTQTTNGSVTFTKSEDGFIMCGNGSKYVELDAETPAYDYASSGQGSIFYVFKNNATTLTSFLTTKCDNKVPAPTIETVETPTTITLNWAAVTGIDNWNVTFDGETTTVNTNAYKATGLDIESEHSYKVVAVPAGDYCGAIATSGSVSTIACNTPTPENLSVTGITATTATLNWDAIDGASAYKVYVTDGSNEITKEVETNSYEVTGLTPSFDYMWSVKAFVECWGDANENGEFKTLATVAKFNLTLNATNGEISSEPEAGLVEEGEDVMMEAINPAEGYMFGSWSYTGLSEADVEIDENTLAFTMPHGDVTVTANFIEIPIITWKVCGETVATTPATNGKVGTVQDAPTTWKYNNQYKYFAGWVKGEDVETPVYATADMPITENTTFNAAFSKAGKEQYQLLTDVTTLAVGDKLIIVAANNSNYYAAGDIPSNQKYLLAETIPAPIESVITITNEAIDKFTLGGDEDVWTLHCDKGYLKTSKTKENAWSETADTWKISIDDDVTHLQSASISGDEFYFNYNGGTTPRFKNYTSKQGQISIYRFIGNTYENLTIDPQPDYARTDLVVGNYGTICLPNAVNAGDYSGAVFYSIVGYQGSKDNPTGIVIESVEGKLKAGMPYIFKATANQIIATYIGEAVSAPVTDTDPTAANGLIGSFETRPLVNEDGSDIYGIKNNALRKLTTEGEGNQVGANRAYIDMSQMISAAAAPAPAPGAHRVAMNNSSYSAPTNFNGLNGNVKAQKVMKDGQLYIIRDTKMYNAQGIEVQ